MTTAAKFFPSKSEERRIRFTLGRMTDDQLVARLGELSAKRILSEQDRGMIEVIREELEDRFSAVSPNTVEFTT